MLLMLIFVLTGNKDVIDVHESETETTKHLALKPLEYLGWVSQSKKHVKKFSRLDGALIAVFGISIGAAIELRENHFIPQAVGEIADSWNLVTVRYSCIVRCTTITKWAPVAAAF